MEAKSHDPNLSPTAGHILLGLPNVKFFRCEWGSQTNGGSESVSLVHDSDHAVVCLIFIADTCESGYSAAPTLPKLKAKQAMAHEAGKN